MIVIFILSFQGPTGGLTFPMNGVSLHWFYRLWEGGGIVDIAGAFKRSLALGLVVMVLTVLLLADGGPRVPQEILAARTSLFFVTVASLIVPSIVTSLGIAIEFHVLDDLLKNYGPSWIADNLYDDAWACSRRASARI